MTMRSERSVIRRFALASAVFSAALLAGSSTARAADATIPLDTTIVAGTAGDQVELAEVAGGLLIGRTCDLTAIHAETGAPHPDNDLVVSSGADVVTLADVERASGAVTPATAPLMIGDTIRIEVILGPDAAFGGDVALEVDCSQGDGVLAL
ncbi:MAG: hypothetical protein QNM02_08705, partial [Acidimicrobiia bacterium]|nr:hypothetical protein [Acidimicrobiia bacterium]